MFTDKEASTYRNFVIGHVHLWVMVCEIGMGYGVWESLVHLAGNQLGGHEKVWVMRGYGLLEVWVKTEATVFDDGINCR
jgi:hypothetical protein